jgi:hypothetical protein
VDQKLETTLLRSHKHPSNRVNSHQPRLLQPVPPKIFSQLLNKQPNKVKLADLPHLPVLAEVLAVTRLKSSASETTQ